MLVTYASRKGATTGVAGHVAAGLLRRGLAVDLRPVEQVRDLSRYHAIVFGAAVYSQQWPGEGREFIARNVESLARIPLWLFSVGSFGDEGRFGASIVRKEPQGIAALCEELDARDYRVFAGVVQASEWPWYGRLFFRASGGRFGDNRDWAAIDAWAQQIAGALASDSVSAAASGGVSAAASGGVSPPRQDALRRGLGEEGLPVEAGPRRAPPTR